MIGTNTTTGQGVSIDASKLIGTHACVIGNTGSGKTHTIRKLLEDTWGDALHVIIDPEREFHTLRQAHPYVIMGGPHADVPRGDPTRLAEHIVGRGLSVIIQFEDHEHQETQAAIIGSFLNGLMALPRPFWRPVFIVIDEAHRYAPQVGTTKALRPICTLMSQGRKRGFTGILATQRLAKLDKNASGEANTWLIGRVGQVTDRNAAANNLGFPLRSDEAIGLRTLAPGQFWGFGVALGDLPQLIQVGATATQHMRLGENFTPAPLPEKPARPRGNDATSRPRGAPLLTALSLLAVIAVPVSLALIF